MQSVKMRVIYSTSKKKVLTFATAIGEAFKCQVDDVPPGFPCDKEKLVVICMTMKDKPDDKLRRFCGELNKQRALNVALIVDGNKDCAGVKQVRDILTEAGTNVIDEVYTIDGGGFFSKKISLQERTDIVNWVDGVITKTFGQAN